MSFLANKYKGKCRRCGKDLMLGEGFVVPRNFGFEVSCGIECLKKEHLSFQLGGNNHTTIEVRNKIPQITGVIAEERYKQVAMRTLIDRLKIHYGDNYSAKLNKKEIHFKDGSDIDTNGDQYVYVKAVVRSKKNNVIKQIITI